MLTSTDNASAYAPPRRFRRAWQGGILAVLAVVLTLEVPGRAIYYLSVVKFRPQTLLAGAYPEPLRQQLTHDFLDPRTRMQYDFDMFLGWRAKPHQHGFTYRINGAGRRDNVEHDHIAIRVIFLVGGSAAWSLGASDNEHTLAAYLERSINQTLPSQERVQVLNLAEQAYGLRQESHTVLDNIEKGPELVLFYDGVNDLYTILSGKDPYRYRAWGDFPDILKVALRQATGSSFILMSRDFLEFSMTWHMARLMRQVIVHALSNRSHVPPPPLSSAQQEQIERFFHAQLTHNQRLLHALGVQTLFVLQPIGYVDKPMHERENFLHSQPAWWQAAYRVLEHEYETFTQHKGMRALSLAHIFHNEKRQIYLDPVHTNDLGNQIVGEFLAQKVLEILALHRP